MFPVRGHHDSGGHAPAGRRRFVHPRATSPWMGKVTGSIVALIAYKPVGRPVYATGLAFISDTKAARTFVIGLAVLACR